MLLDGRRGGGVLLDVGGYHDGVELVQLQPLVLAPCEELTQGLAVGAARVPVANVGREEFEEPESGLLTGADNRGREAVELPSASGVLPS